MGDERCCERECVRDCRDNCCNDNCCCDNCCCDDNNGISIIWILIILYLLFCAGGNGNGRGGLFGGLF